MAGYLILIWEKCTFVVCATDCVCLCVPDPQFNVFKATSIYMREVKGVTGACVNHNDIQNHRHQKQICEKGSSTHIQF